MVFYSVQNTAGGSNRAESSKNMIVYGKTKTSFICRVYNTSSEVLPINSVFYFWVVYVNNGASSNGEHVTTYPYFIDSVGTSNFSDMFSSCYYTSYTLNTANFPTSGTSFVMNVDCSTKGWSNTNYVVLVSVESTSVDASTYNTASKANWSNISGHTGLGKTSTVFNVYISLNNFTTTQRTDMGNSVRYNILAVKAEILETTHYVSNYYINNTRLSQLYPMCSYYYTVVSNNNSPETQTIALSGNTYSYIIMTSLAYNSGGSGGTYSQYSAATTTKPVISAKSATSLSTVFNKGTGNNWNGGVYHLVIFEN
jgi:hypothetical protein